jgi:hypothetical protein
MGNNSDPDAEKRRIIELYALVQLGLGHDLAPTTFTELAQIQASFHKQQDDLVLFLENGKIDKKQYLVMFNAALRAMMDQNKKLLGSKDFERIFGAAGDTPENLIDPDAFLNQNMSGPNIR